MPSPTPAATHPAADSPGLAALWKTVLANAPLLAAAAACNPANVAQVAQLRKQGPGPEIKLALDLAMARKKAALKFPAALAGRIVADPQAVEQASSWAVGQWKAKRFAAAVAQASACANSPTQPATQAEACATQAQVFDLCCGAGFDTLALMDAGLKVEACDLNPTRAWMAQQNTGKADHPVIRCADLASYAGHPDLANALLHLDPARRNESGRIFNLADYLPGPEVWAPLLRQAKGACVKLAPGVSHAELADFANGLGMPWSTSFVSDHGKLVQALLWTGVLAQSAPREAVLIEKGQVHQLTGRPGSPMPIWGDPAFLLEPDDAIERAQLSNELGKGQAISDLHPGLGLLTAGTLGEACALPASPWFTAFKVLESFSWDEKKAKVALKAHDAGLVEVKTRGQICDPNKLEKKLRGEGKERLTLFVLRLGSSLRGFVTRREGRVRYAERGEEKEIHAG